MDRAQYYLQRYHEDGLTQEEIGRELGVTRQAVSKQFRQWGISTRRQSRLMRRYGADLETWLRECLESGLSAHAIAKEAGIRVSADAVHAALRHFGISYKALRLSGRFWSKVNICGGSCWEWRGSLSPTGYGRFRLDGKGQLAHRVAWRLTQGSIPEGMCICHHCDNPPCCNPGHLFLGTRADNCLDMWAKGRGRGGGGGGGGGARGEAHGSSKLTESNVLEIRRLWAETDLYQREIAEMFGVSTVTISACVNRRTWREVG